MIQAMAAKSNSAWWQRAGVVLVAFVSVVGQSQTNFPAAQVPPPVAGLWDYADALGFSAQQREAAGRIRAGLEAAGHELELGTVTNTPPDVQREARLQYSRQVRALKAGLAELLTPEQQLKYAALRPARKALPRANGSTNSAGVAEGQAAGVEESVPGEMNAARVPVRPVLTAAQGHQLAVDLREMYSRPASRWPAPNLDEEAKVGFAEIGLLPPVTYPADNPYSDAKAALGKRLFFDPRLSGSGQIACASCHDPDLAWTDGRTVSFGHARKVLKRNAPMILNSGHLRTPFWDGRVNSLEAQAIAVLNNEDEMRSGPELVRQRLLAIPGYAPQFAAGFGSPEVSIDRVGQAIATFERTVNSRANPFDSFLRGDTNALGESALRGLHLFRTAARCINCHNGPNFTDGRFHNEGLSYYGRKYEDLGRYAVTHKPEDVGRFKTPSLRNVARTGPYMHNGLFELDAVLAMYNAGMPRVRPLPRQKNDPLFPQKSPLLQPLGLNPQDIADLKAFLESLSEARFSVRPPESF